MSVNETNETNETGVGGARADMLAHMGSLQQAAYTRPIEYQEGRAHGLKAIEVKNGPLRFVSMADRALDVCQFEYRGENLTFLSKPGLNGRNQFDTNGLEAQRSIMGGLFFTCGFENICAPYVTPEGGKYPAGSFPMHGRIRTTPAATPCSTNVSAESTSGEVGFARRCSVHLQLRTVKPASAMRSRMFRAIDMHRVRGMPAFMPMSAMSSTVMPRPLPLTAVVCSPLIPGFSVRSYAGERLQAPDSASCR